MGALIKIILGFVAALVLLVLLAPAILPTDSFKALLTEQVEKATGRTLTLAGPIHVSVYPVFGFTAEDVRLANAPWASAPDMLTLKELQVGVAVLPLLQGKISIASFILRDPVLALETNAKGQSNWQFIPARQKAAAQSQTAAQNPALAFLQDVSLQNVRVTDGQVTLHTGGQPALELRTLNATLTLAGLDAPLEATLSALYRERTVEAEVVISKLRALLEQEATPLELRVNAADLNLALTGQLQMEATPRLSGRGEIAVPSLRNLAAWLAEPLNIPGEGFGLFKVEGDITATPTRLAVSNAHIWFDKSQGKAALALELSGSRPSLSGNLALDALDTNLYAPPAAAGPPQDAAPAALADWSDAPLDLAVLKSAEADVKLTLDALTLGTLRVQNAALHAVLTSGRLTLDLTRLALYEGQGTGKLTLNSASQPPTLGLEARLQDIQALGLLQDAIALDKLEGKGDLSLTLAAQGATQRALVKNLTGAGQFQLKDGAIRGINLPAMARNIGSAFLDPKAGEVQKTDFAELAASFTVKQGVMQNDDLRLSSPLLRVEGAGQVDLPARTVNYRVTPTVVASLEGQGATGAAGGLTIPVTVTGSLDKLKFAPDLSGVAANVIKDPGAALGNIKNSVKDAVKNPADMLKGLFGQ